jgi:mono/diheme cytochrome c family protein
MISKLRISFLLACLLTIALAVPVFAGGWAVITLDELPSNIVVGDPLAVGFTVLQHGRTLMSDLNPTITADSGSEQFLVNAEADGAPGHYSAILTFPTAGDWTWSIQAFTMQQAMPVLNVATAIGSENPPVPGIEVLTVFPLSRGIALLALGLALVAVVFAYRRRSRPIAALTAICLLGAISLFAAGTSSVPKVEAQSKPAPVAQVDLGKKLFIAKGCITCHSNEKAARPSDYWTLDVGAPNLTTYSSSPDLLRARLHDPASVKSDTQMPKLTLSDAEIEALIAFINSK